MERERLTRLVGEPGMVGRGDVADLQMLVERFPWFAGAQVLRSLGEQKLGEVGAEEVLRAAAAHVPSRAVLFDLVTAQEQPVAVQLTVVRKEEDPVVPFAEHVPDVPPQVEVPKEPEQTDLAPGPVELGDEEDLPAPSTGLEQEAGPETSDEASAEIDLGPEVPTGSAPDPLDLQIREAAMATAYDISYLEQLPPSVPAKQAVTVDPPPVLAAVLFEVPKPDATGRPVIAKHDRLRFTDWLAVGMDVHALADTPPTTGTPPPDSADWLRTPPVEAKASTKRSIPEEPPVEEPRTAAPVLEQVDTRELIDRFIRQQTPVPPPKHDTFYTPQQAAKRSLDDTAGIVTETLARVYVKQGNLPKAIRAYHKLALKYPEKSAYFAALAKELEAQQPK